MRLLIVVVMAALAGGCASTGATPRPFPTPAGSPAAVPSGTAGGGNTGARGTAGGRSIIGYSVAGTALSLRGAPYRSGGSDPTGFDCSGFVRYVFGQHGVIVPRTVTELFRAGRQIGGDQLQAGDLVFFATVAPGASHVGIAIGGDEFVHAPSSTGEVRVERLGAPYWATRFVGARRVL